MKDWGEEIFPAAGDVEFKKEKARQLVFVAMPFFASGNQSHKQAEFDHNLLKRNAFLPWTD